MDLMPSILLGAHQLKSTVSILESAENENQPKPVINSMQNNEE